MGTRPENRPRAKARSLKIGLKLYLAKRGFPRPRIPMAVLRVLSFRLERSWSQGEAAAWYGVSERTWRRWENGERTVPRAVLNRIRSARKFTRPSVAATSSPP